MTTEDRIDHAMVDAYRRAYNATWQANVATTQGEAVALDGRAIRAGLAAALDAASNARRTAWAVTAGEYSDFHVLCLYENEADARAALNAGVGDNIESLPLLPPGDVPRQVPVYHAHAAVCRDGEVEEREPWSFDEWDFTEPVDFEERSATVYGTTGYHFTGTDRARVAKAAHDRAARLRAEREDIA